MGGRGKRAGEGEGNCEVVPTPKQCPSWVVAKFKARWCNPHTGRRLRLLFYHDSEVANFACCHLFADFFKFAGVLVFIFLGRSSPGDITHAQVHPVPICPRDSPSCTHGARRYYHAPRQSHQLTRGTQTPYNVYFVSRNPCTRRTSDPTTTWHR